MFTGLVEELGSVREVTGDGSGARLTIAASTVLDGARVGDSISVNGCCLTVVDLGPGHWSADAVSETLARTTLGALTVGDRVNLERPAVVGGRLGGHLVQGHVDGVGTVLSPAPDLVVRAPGDLLRYLVTKGSITVDGCSLTVVAVSDDAFSVAVIPHTAAVTTLGFRQRGDLVNLEVDVVAKYVERLLAAGDGSVYAPPSGPVPSENP